MPYKRYYSNRSYSRPSSSYYGRALKRRSKKKSWGGGFAGYRKAAMGSFMRNLWQTYPSKPTAELLAARQEHGPATISGVGDYEFTPGGSHSIGSRVGAWLGDKAQSVLGRITGLGDYSVMKNTLVNDPPSVRNNSARTVTLSHREYIGDVVTGAANTFNLQAYKIQPGDPATFPWLSTIASQFQQYTLDGMIFQFKSMSADALNSTNTALGQVIMATNYNVSAPLFDSKYEMENTEFSSSVKPSCSAMHPIECARRESTLNELYVAPGGSIPDNKDPSFYDFGNFQIATNGFQAAGVNIGELWVTYEVTLLKPILNSINGSQNLWSLQYRRALISNPVDSTGLFRAGSNLLQYPLPVPGVTNTMEIVYSGTKGSIWTFKRIGSDLPFPVGTVFVVTFAAAIAPVSGQTPDIPTVTVSFETNTTTTAVANVVNALVVSPPVAPTSYTQNYDLAGALASGVSQSFSFCFRTVLPDVLPSLTVLGQVKGVTLTGGFKSPELLINVSQIREDQFDSLY